MSELVWRIGVMHRFGWRAYFREYPPRILLLTSLPRLVLQTAFFVLLGGVVGGTGGQEFALVGAAATTMTLFTAISISEVPAMDVHSATFYRHRMAVVGPFVSVLVRSAPHAAGALASAAISIWAVGAATGHLALAGDLTRCLPLYALMAVSGCMAGLTVAIVSTPSYNDLLASNVLAYALLVTSGAIFPAERLGVFAEVGEILPMRHGITSLRAILDGQPWVGSALAEAAVGLGWAVLGWMVLWRRVRNARVRGAEDFG